MVCHRQLSGQGSGFRPRGKEATSIKRGESRKCSATANIRREGKGKQSLKGVKE